MTEPPPGYINPRWPVCHMCKLRCSPTGAWIDCRTEGADTEQVAIYYVKGMRGRICDLSGPTLDMIAARLPATTRRWKPYGGWGKAKSRLG